MLEFFSPKSVAIIGASNDVTKLGGMLVKNMLDAGYKGKPERRGDTGTQGVH